MIAPDPHCRAEQMPRASVLVKLMELVHGRRLGYCHVIENTERTHNHSGKHEPANAHSGQVQQDLGIVFIPQSPDSSRTHSQSG